MPVIPPAVANAVAPATAPAVLPATVAPAVAPAAAPAVVPAVAPAVPAVAPVFVPAVLQHIAPAGIMHGFATGLNPAPNLAHPIVLENSLGAISNHTNHLLERHVHVKENPYIDLYYSSGDEKF